MLCVKGNVAKNSNFYFTNVSTATRVSERIKIFKTSMTPEFSDVYTLSRWDY